MSNDVTNGGEYMTTAVSDNVCIRHIDNIGIATLLKHSWDSYSIKGRHNSDRSPVKFPDLMNCPS